jgi:hypothetical protein
MALSIDGLATSHSVSSSVISASLTTTKTNNIIVAIVTSFGSATTVTGVTATGLTFTKRLSTGVLGIGGGNNQDIDVWWAPCPTVITSKSISATYAGGNPSFPGLVVFGVNGASLANPWDTGTSGVVNHSTSAGATPTVSGLNTNNPNCLILGACALNDSATGDLNKPGTGFTDLINNASTSAAMNGVDVEYKIVSAKQVSVAVAFGSSENNTASDGFIMYADAIAQFVSISGFNMPMLGM